MLSAVEALGSLRHAPVPWCAAVPEPAFAIYVTRQGADDDRTAKETMRAMGRKLRTLYDDGRLTGFQVVAVTDESDYVAYEIDEEWLEAKAVGPPPFLYVQVGWEQSRPGPRIDDVIVHYALRELAHVPNPH